MRGEGGGGGRQKKKKKLHKKNFFFFFFWPTPPPREIHSLSYAKHRMAQAIASAASVAQRRAVAVHVCLGNSINS